MFRLGDKVLVVDNSYIKCINTGKQGLLVQGSMYGCDEDERGTTLTVIKEVYSAIYYDKYNEEHVWKKYINVISSNTGKVYAVWEDGCIMDDPKTRAEREVMATFDDAINAMMEDMLDDDLCFEPEYY